LTITGYKSYAILKISTDAAAWVRLYTDSGSRSNDLSRSQTTDPTPGSGVILEVITSGDSTQLITPAVLGFNNDGDPTSNIYATVTNLSGTTRTITIRITMVALEL
jgi:hypothetical protein